MRKLLGGAFLALLLASAAVGEDGNTWGEVEGWIIGVDASLGNSCFAVTTFEDGTAVRFGYDSTSGNQPFYILFGNQKWRSLEVGKDYDLVIRLDNEAPWDAPARGVTLGDGEMVFLAVGTSESEFLQEITRKHGIVIEYEGREIASLSLHGSYKATIAMSQCQLETGGGATDADDPFSEKPKSRGDDPFA